MVHPTDVNGEKKGMGHLVRQRVENGNGFYCYGENCEFWAAHHGDDEYDEYDDSDDYDDSNDYDDYDSHMVLLMLLMLMMVMMMMMLALVTA